MKTTMKRAIAGFCITLISACEKAPMPQQGINTAISGPYLSVNDFLQKNAIPVQTYTIPGGSGGNFTTPQGTIVTIPPNAFVYPNGNPVASTVTIEFKDIYKKSDMLFNNMPTMYKNTYPMKSAGEFYIKAISNGQTLQLNSSSAITISQPTSQSLDFSMQSFLYDSINGWAINKKASVTTDSTLSHYMYNIFSLDSISWCNTDDTNFFSKYTHTKITFQPNDDPRQYNTRLWLIFKDVNSAVYVHEDCITSNFPYLYAPLGLQCTLVAWGIYNGNLYSSFVPITIGANQTYSFSLSLTSTNNFTAQLNALN